MKEFFAGVLASIQSFFNPHPPIVYHSLIQAPAQVADSKPAIDDGKKCQVSFFVGSEPQRRKFKVLGEFEIPEGAYGDGSEMAYVQFDDLIKRLRPMACKNGGNTVRILTDPAVKGVRKAQLILMEAKSNS